MTSSYQGLHAFGDAIPRHPLNALRRIGTVVDVSNVPTTIGINVGGDTNSTVQVPYLDKYYPQVGDTVVVLTVGNDHIVLDRLMPKGYTTYTPVLTAVTTNPTGWTVTGLWRRDSDTVSFEITATATTGFTLGTGTYMLSLPFAVAAGTPCPVGNAQITNSDFFYVAMCDGTSGTSAFRMIRADNQAALGTAGPFGNAWANNNIIRVNGVYRAS